MNAQQEAECDKLIRNGLMHDDTEKDGGVKEGVAVEEKGWIQGEVARWSWWWGVPCWKVAY